MEKNIYKKLHDACLNAGTVKKADKKSGIKIKIKFNFKAFIFFNFKKGD